MLINDIGGQGGHGLGRRPALDERDKGYRLAPLTSAAQMQRPPRPYGYWWAGGWWGDQGATSQCTAYAALHYLHDGPMTHRTATRPAWPPVELYRWAQDNDEWAGTDYDGTSVRAIVKALQARGAISEYRWTWNVATAIDTLDYFGPVIAGTNWYGGMFRPDEAGLLTVEGSLAGGHAYVLNGFNREKGLVRLKNSWGRDWGRSGYAWLRFEDLARLIAEGGEICLATEKRLA